MWKLWNRRSQICTILGLAIALIGFGALPQGTANAQQNSKKDLPVVDGETQLYPGYPRQFDGHGLIDRMGENEIVISDGLFPLPTRADLHTPRSSRASIGRFAEGDYVGYQLDETGSIESLWLLKKGKR